MRTLIAVVRKFEILVTAESATTSEDAAFLVAKGIDYLQVFPLGAPSHSTMGVLKSAKTVGCAHFQCESASDLMLRQAVSCCKCSVPVCWSELEQGTMRHSFVRGFSQLALPTSHYDHHGKGLTI